MKILKFIFITACLITLAACVGGGSVKSSVDDDPRIMDEFTVPENGAYTYTGAGDFEGFGVTVSDSALAGRTIYLEKIEPDYNIDGYAAVSDIYSISLSDSVADSRAAEVFSAEIMLPFSSSLVTAEGGNSGDVVLCSVSAGSVSTYSTTLGQGAYISGSATIPRQFFAGYQGGSALEESSGTISIKGISYKTAMDAGDTIDDPANNPHPDISRGIRFVQPGERVILGINEEAFEDEVLTHSWSLTEKPSGSASTLTTDGDDVILLADTAGSYSVQLSLSGVNGATSTETMMIMAKTYTYDSDLDDAFCFLSCHDGSYATDEADDKLRDLVTPWGGTAHATAFSSVSTETDLTCFQCHTTGFFFADRNDDGTDEYSAANGYDDTVTNWAAPNGGDDHLKGVTCEACHGPGEMDGSGFLATHYSATPISSAVCLSCHDYGTLSGHSFEYSDSHDSAHMLAGGSVSKNSGCFKCHTGQGALGVIHGETVTPETADTIDGITCVVCHDPHGEDGNNASLRITGSYDIQLTTGVHTVDAGDGRVCYNCHNADTALPAVGTIPHNSQAEMMQGVGGYTYNANTTEYKSIHAFMGVTCNDCHLNKQEGVTHNFVMSDDVTSRLTICADCHTGEDPVYENGHYEYYDRIETIRAKIAELKETINEKAGFDAATAVKASYSASDDALEASLNRAAYNYNFIMADRSNGLHNPNYAKVLLDMSLNDLANY